MKINRRKFVKDSTKGLAGLSLISHPDILSGLNLKFSDTDDILYSSVYRLKEMILKKELSSFEIVSAFIHRIERVNPLINAVVAFRPEEALKEAKRMDMDLARGYISGPLHGIPCTIKDSFDTNGIVSTAGTLGRAGYIPSKDATVVERLRNAGAIILGKTNTPELTMEFFTDNLVYGKTKNPYNTDYSPGGSSGGATAIIASGGSPFDIGTDTGGSIRFPSHCCGISGMKPTAGRVPRTGHVISFRGGPQFLTHVGPLARSIEDLDLLTRVIQGPDGIDPYVYPVAMSEYQNVDLTTIRIAFFTYNGIYSCSEEIISTIQKAVNILSNSNLNIREGVPEAIENTAELSNDLINTTDWLSRLLKKCGTTHTSLTWVEDSKEPNASEYNQLLERTDDYKSKMLSFWNNFDVLICPVNPSTAQLLDTPYEGEPYYSYTSAFNITGWPALVIPGGKSISGLPIGIQIVASPWREDVALALANFLQKEIGIPEPPVIGY